MFILGYVSVIEAGNTKIEENAKQKWKIQNGRIIPVFWQTNQILNASVNTKDPEGFNQKVEQ